MLRNEVGASRLRYLMKDARRTSLRPSRYMLGLCLTGDVADAGFKLSDRGYLLPIWLGWEVLLSLPG